MAQSIPHISEPLTEKLADGTIKINDNWHRFLDALATALGTAETTLATAILQGKHTIWVPAGSMIPRVTNGAALNTTELVTNDIALRTLDYDQTTHEAAQFQIAMPTSWDEGTVTFVPYWTASAGSGGVAWGLAAVAVANDEALDVAFGTEVASVDTLIATGDLHVGPESAAVTVSGSPADSEMVMFQLRRVVSNGSDTLTADAMLIGIKLLYTINATTDA